MKQLTIISGKGGTGKTTVASNFINMANDHIAVDCDVDAANLHILLEPKIISQEEFSGGAIATVTGECINCGKCEELCRFEAITDSETDIKIDDIRCEGCGVCVHACPVDAWSLNLRYKAQALYRRLTSAPWFMLSLYLVLKIPVLLITKIRNMAEDIANEEDLKVGSD
ncbi:MAG: 4Fe-4S binding protein [Actinomycetota bacterium]|nr:4Fe-4S binding protein [Actinomycetota bacterium]